MKYCWVGNLVVNAQSLSSTDHYGEYGHPELAIGRCLISICGSLPEMHPRRSAKCTWDGLQEQEVLYRISTGAQRLSSNTRYLNWGGLMQYVSRKLVNP